MKNHISIQNLNAFYNDQHTLHDINVEIPEKQITAIIGPSGCGKSTLLKCLNRLIDITDGARVTGEIIINGIDVLDGRVDVFETRRKMGLLAQKPTPLPMSIYENIAYGPKIHGLKKKPDLDAIVEKYLKLVGRWVTFVISFCVSGPWFLSILRISLTYQAIIVEIIPVLFKW